MALAVLAVFALLSALLYARLLTWYLSQWNRIPSRTGYHQQILQITVLIAARNEAEHLPACLAAVTRQNYPQSRYEVLVVDDHSTDATKDVVRAFSGVSLLSLADVSEDSQGKKAALTAGMRAASGEVVVMTDADCVAGPDWLASIAAQFAEDVLAVTGPVCYQGMSGLLEHFQALEVLGLMVVTGGGLEGGRHHLGNGANMAVRRNVFTEVGEFKDNAHLSSGDDLFLLEAIAGKHPGSLKFAKTPAAVVRTSAQPTWPALIRQRLRWASKNAALQDQTINLTWIGVWVIHLFLLVSVLCVPFMHWIPGLIVIAAIVVKAYADHRVLSAAAAFTSQENVLRWFIPSFVLNIFYVLYIGVVSVMTRRYEWKDRVQR